MALAGHSQLSHAFREHRAPSWEWTCARGWLCQACPAMPYARLTRAPTWRQPKQPLKEGSQHRQDVAGTSTTCPEPASCQHLSESCDASVPLHFRAALSDLTFGSIHATSTEQSLCARPCLGSGAQRWGRQPALQSRVGRGPHQQGCYVMSGCNCWGAGKPGAGPGDWMGTRATAAHVPEEGEGLHEKKELASLESGGKHSRQVEERVQRASWRQAWWVSETNQTEGWYRTSLVVQWVRLCASNARGTGSIPSGEGPTCPTAWPKSLKKEDCYYWSLVSSEKRHQRVNLQEIVDKRSLDFILSIKLWRTWREWRVIGTDLCFEKR